MIEKLVIKSESKSLFLTLINRVLLEVQREKEKATSPWKSSQLQAVFDEFINLEAGLENGILLFPYGRKQRMLESTYFLTDSLEHLNQTPLGMLIDHFQEEYQRISS